MTGPRPAESLVFRALHADEAPRVSAFVRAVYAAAVAPGESAEGQASYARYSDAEAMRARADRHRVLVAEVGGRLVGVLEVRDGTHVSMLFVDGAWQRRGVARALLAAHFGPMAAWPALSVNSAPGAVGAYARLGFAPGSPASGTWWTPGLRCRRPGSSACPARWPC